MMEYEYILPTELATAIIADTKKYPAEYTRSSILFALKLVQQHNLGYLEDKHLRAVAKLLALELIQVYEVATFYTMIKLKPVGKNLISICNNISCKLQRADELVACVEQYLDIKLGETTTDGNFTLEQAECLAACINAPAMIVNGKYYEKVTPEFAIELLTNLTKEAS